MNNDMLWMHHEARMGRPSAHTMYHLGRLYPAGVRFRVHQEVVRLLGNRVCTMFRPVIEVVMEVKRRKQWVTYMWLDHEGVFA